MSSLSQNHIISCNIAHLKIQIASAMASRKQVAVMKMYFDFPVFDVNLCDGCCEKMRHPVVYCGDFFQNENVMAMMFAT